MLVQIKNKAINVLSKVSRSIAFLPVILILCFLVSAILLIQVENWQIGAWFSGKFEPVIIRNADTARVILSTMVAGLFSLVVFSFSMVMLLLNQASSSFSPRLLPGLISNKRHQFILGVFIGNIVFGLIVIINVLPETRGYKVPGIAVFVCLVLCIISLGLFVYFLHSISQSIQINHILSELYSSTFTKLEKEIEKSDNEKLNTDKNEDWFKIANPKTGHIQSISEESLLNLALEYETNIQVLQPEGTFLVKGVEIIATEKKMDEEQVENISSCLQFHEDEVIAMNFNLGFKQITEIILRAMSPGINDPSTAIMGINYLTELFQLRLQLRDQMIISKEASAHKIIICRLSFEELLYKTMSGIRLYVKHDPQVVLSSLGIFQAMLNDSNLSEKREKIVRKELKALEVDAINSIENKRDKEKIQAAISKLA